MIDVLANDHAAQAGDLLSVTSVTQPGGGSVIVNGDGTLTYVPDVEFAGSDQFHYTIMDADGSTDTATVTVQVEASTPAAEPGVLLERFDGIGGKRIRHLVNHPSFPNSPSASMIGSTINPNTGDYSRGAA